MIPTRADRCSYVLYSIQSRERVGNTGDKGAIAQQNGTKDAFIESRDRSDMEPAFEKKHWIPSLEVQLQENSWQESSINLWMISLEQVETKWNNAFKPDSEKISQVGSEDWDDVTFTRQRMHATQDSPNERYIEFSQGKAIDELEEIPVERNTKEDLICTPAMRTMYRSLPGQINWATE